MKAPSFGQEQTVMYSLFWYYLCQNKREIYIYYSKINFNMVKH